MSLVKVYNAGENAYSFHIANKVSVEKNGTIISSGGRKVTIAGRKDRAIHSQEPMESLIDSIDWDMIKGKYKNSPILENNIIFTCTNEKDSTKIAKTAIDRGTGTAQLSHDVLDKQIRSISPDISNLSEYVN